MAMFRESCSWASCVQTYMDPVHLRGQASRHAQSGVGSVLTALMYVPMKAIPTLAHHCAAHRKDRHRPQAAGRNGIKDKQLYATWSWLSMHCNLWLGNKF